MTLTIPDDLIESTGLTEQEIRAELACRLFEAGRMSFGHAARLAGASEDQMYDEIDKRGIPRYRYTEEHLQQDVRAVEMLKRNAGR